MTEETVRTALRRCYDPEIPVDIVELGLVYGVQIEDRPDGKKRVRVRMTLTAPGCAMGALLCADVERKITELAGVAEARVELVFEPPWNPTMMSEAARFRLGLD